MAGTGSQCGRQAGGQRGKGVCERCAHPILMRAVFVVPAAGGGHLVLRELSSYLFLYLPHQQQSLACSFRVDAYVLHFEHDHVRGCCVICTSIDT
jgi:hypothetical protein